MALSFSQDRPPGNRVRQANNKHRTFWAYAVQFQQLSSHQ